MMRQNFQLSTCNDALGFEYNLRLHINRPQRCRFSVIQSALIMCVGVFLGFVVCDVVKRSLIQQSVCAGACCPRQVPSWADLKILSARLMPSQKPKSQTPSELKVKKVERRREQLVYVGVMTAQKYLTTRAKSVHNSWARYVPGKVEFFTSARIETDLPIVNLPGVEDSVYPPQKKSFMMLKYMHDYHIDDYEWFIRADDDVFIHGERLSRFLYSLNSSRRLYVGQAGQGIVSEHGLLGLDPTGNYCMGGTTMIFSRATLRRMVPEINFCIKHLVSTHEDVEIGRCVRKFAKTNCPWAFEFRNLFYQNHEEANGSFTKPGVLKKMVKPITMHPVKDSQYLYRMQAHFLDQKVRDLRHKILLLYRDLKSTSTMIDKNVSSLGFPAFAVLNKIHPETAKDVLTWAYYDKNLYSADDPSPKRKIPQVLYEGIDTVVSDSMRIINHRARELGRHIDFRGLLYGYFRVDPLHSADYITDLLLSYHKHRGKSLKIPVRRHSYLHQPFTLPEVRFRDVDDRVVYFVAPSLGRREALIRFLKAYENVALKNKLKTELIFVNFDASNSADHLRIETNVERLNSIYNSRIEILKGDGEFSRAKALQQGALHCPENALLFFVDLDIDFDTAALRRVKLNTVENGSAYFPIVFSQYNPRLVCKGKAICAKDNFVFSQTRGYWRHFGFGIASIYRRDFLNIGGFDLGIKGWGKEDVDFYTKSVKSHLTIFRSPDPGLVHIYHKVTCPKSLAPAQMKMCLGSMRSNLAPYTILSQIVYQNLSTFDGIHPHGNTNTTT